MAHNKKTHAVSPPNDDYVRVIPLGGLDEVGANCCLIECNGSMLMVDCGLTFPEVDNFGIDIILPDWSYVLDNLDHLDGVLLTHGHEDHIGALPFFLGEVDVPVYGGRFTLDLLARKLEEYDLRDVVERVPVEPGEILEIGPHLVEFVHVNHSIPNAMSISLGTPLGRLVFTGDWKLDQTPLNGPVADIQRFGEFGSEGTLALLGDSTNSSTPGFSISESDVQRGLREVIERAEGRAFVTMFSSNVERLGGLLEVAEQLDRKVVLLGRSLRTRFASAQEMGFLKMPSSNVIISPNRASDFPDDRLLILTTGSQAEPRSGLVRMSRGENRGINIKQGDTVVFSARRIPGNEYGINHLINNLAKRGAHVIDKMGEVPIHGSGHAHREELKLMINLTQPQYLVPMHGEFQMRANHAEIGRSVGVPETRLIRNGDILQFTADGAEVIDKIHTGRILVDGSRTGDVSDMAIRNRRKIARAGMIVAFVVIDIEDGSVVTGPDLLDRGFLGDEPEDRDLRDAAARYAFREISELSDEARRDLSEVKEALRLSIRRFFRKEIDRKPVVIPVVHEL
jgi:ribonuclease J